MREKASVVVVGAGVIGCSVAFQLARMGRKDVVVLEREALPGSGSTSRATSASAMMLCCVPSAAWSLNCRAIMPTILWR